MPDRDDLVPATRSFDPVQKQQLADQVMRQLQERIASGEFAIGDRLPSEPHLMQQLGVGRTTIREAVRVLAHIGQLEVRQGSGTYVRALSPGGDLVDRLRQAHVSEVYQVRRALEVEIARLAALRRDDSDLVKIRKLMGRMKENLRKGSKEAFLDADMELYAALARSTKNTVLVELHGSFANALRGALTQVMVFPGVMNACLSRHERVFRALVERDAKTAEKATAQFLERVSKLIEDLLGGDARIADGLNRIRHRRD